MQADRRPTAIITGAARGIGAATATALATRGYNVVLAVRDRATAGQAAEAVTRLGAAAMIEQCNVASQVEVQAMIEQTAERFGRIDVLVNNAGTIDPIAPTGETDAADWAHSIEVNLVGAYNCARSVLPHMLQAGGGTIINLSSGAAHSPLEGWSAYCSAKAGLAMFTRTLALEYKDRGIRIFGLAPGTTDTDMQATIRASGINPISRLDRNRLVPVHEPAEAIAYCCSPAANDLAGHELALNDDAFRSRIGMRLLDATG